MACKLNKHFGGGIPIRFDLLKLAKRLAGKERALFKHLFYYLAPPFQSTNPTEQEKYKKERYDSFIDRLSRSNEITIREGRCQKIKEDGQTLYKQKGVDTLLTMDLMDVPIEHPKIQEIILIASDSDFVPVIRRLQKRGINTILYTYFDRKRNSKFSTSNELLNAVSRYVQLKKEDFEESNSQSYY